MNVLVDQKFKKKQNSAMPRNRCFNFVSVVAVFFFSREAGRMMKTYQILPLHIDDVSGGESDTEM